MRKTLLLFTVLLFGLQGWATTFTVDGVTYTITDATNKTVAIGTGTSTAAISKSTTGTFTIPSSVSYNGDSYAVTKIGDYAFVGSHLTSISIPNSVTDIANSCFNSCPILTEVSIPLSVTSIGMDAFIYCSELTTVSIPASVASIGIDAFGHCAKLTSITVDSNNPNYRSVDGVLFNKNITSLIQYPIGNTQMSYSIPNTVSTIGRYAFESGFNLTTVSIPPSVTSLDSRAFYGCTGLTSIYANNSDPGKIKLGSQVFDYVPTATCTIYVPTGSKSLYAVADQWKDHSIVEQDNTFAIFANSSPIIGGTITGSSAYLSGALCTLTATPVAGYVFSGWTEGGTIVSTDASYTFPVSATRTLVANFYSIISASANPAGYGSIFGAGNYVVGSSCTLTATPTTGYAFSKWTENGSTVSTNSSYTFTVNTARTLVANFINTYRLSLSVNSDQGGVVTGSGTYGNGTSQTITATPNDGYGFKSWVNNKGTVLSTSKSYTFTLTKDSTVIANFVKTYDFADASGLCYKISSPTTAYVTYRSPNGGDYSGAITVPVTATINGASYNVTAIGDSAFYNCSNLTSITLPDVITSVGTSAFEFCSNLASVALSNSLRSLSTSLFRGCFKLTEITIPNSVATIEDDALFACTGLISLTIPASVVSIGIDAFGFCTGLTSITVENNNPNYWSVDGVLFNKNKTNLIQYPLGNTQTSYSIPNTVITIGQDAFKNGLNLASIVIPSSVTSINGAAFYYCIGLRAIYANVIDPVKITLGNQAFDYVSTSSCTIYVPIGSKSLYTAANKWKDYSIVEQDNTFAIFANSSPTIGGTITGSSAYTSGTLCTLTATPVAGYVFSGWTEGRTVVSTDASYTFTVNTSRTLIANFYSIISASANPAGYGSVSGGGNYTTGSSCTLTATPASGYAFSKWTEKGSTVSTNSSYTFTVSAARNLVANFVNTYRLSLSVNLDQGGVVTGGGTYGNGSSQTITATPNDGYGFICWLNNKNTVLSNSKSYTLTLTKDSTLTARFAKTYDFADNNGLYYKISSPTTAYVTYRNLNGGDYSGAIVVPSTVTINGTSYNVTAIGDSAFYRCSGLTSISIANSVTAIGSYSFYYCNKLTSITLPDAITSVGTYAFASCSNLTSITLPGYLTSLSAYLFSSCSKLTTITIPNSITTIGNSSFNSCNGLKEVSIPASVVAIGVYAFENCTGLTSITVENNNPNYCSVDGVLFNKNKTSLIQYPVSNTQTSYSIPNTVNTIGVAAFENGTKLTSVSIPASVSSINSLAFYYCTGLRSICANNIDPGKITLESYVFSSVPTSTCTLYVPTGSKSLYAAANQWKAFTNITEAILTPRISISPSQSTICSGSAVTFTATTTDGGDSPVYQWKLNGGVISGATNSSYTTASLNNNDIITCDITSSASCLVSNSATSNSIKMTVNPIVTPSVSITSSAAATYPGGSVTFTATPTNGGTSPAYQWYLNGTAIPGATKSTYTSATLSNYDEVSCVLTGNMSCASTPTATSNTISMKVSKFFTTGGICYYITSSSYPYTVSVADDGSASYSGNVTIPSSVSYCGNTFKITSIGDYAFMASKDLVSVTIPSSVSTVGYSAFRDCDRLTSIVVDAANPNYYSIDGVVFNKKATNLILCPEGKSDSYIIPSSVTAIADSAFVNCDKLTSVILPSSVTSIGNYAFMACSGIKSITLLHSIKSIGDDAFTNCTGLTSIHVNNAFPSAITLGVSLFYGVSGSDCTTYVPMGSKSLYEDVYPWNKFNIVEETGLFAVYATASSTVGEVTGSGTYTSASLCTLKAIPSTGYAFTAWTENGAIISTNANYSFTVSGTHTFVANFAKIYAISSSVSSTVGGTVTGSGSYVSGLSCTFTATANSSYVFVNWTENGVEVSKDASYTFTVDQARTLVANFTSANSSINATSSSTSKGTVTGGGTYTYGSTCTLTATPKTGYVFAGWTENGTVVSTNPSYTFAVNAARTLVANFSTVGVTVTQPTATTLSGSIVVTPSTGFTYSLDGINYQTSNEFPYVSIGTYNVTLKNSFDGTVSSPVLVVINASGVVAANNYQIKASNCTCRDTKDGAIDISLAKSLDYTVYVTGTNTDYKTAVMFSGTSFNLKNLPADIYKLVFKIDFLDNYEQSFNVVVTQPEDLSVLKVRAEKSSAMYALSGGTNYYVTVNDNTTETQAEQVQVSLVPGENKIKIYTDKLCQGLYEETIFNSENGQISLFPNPTTGKIIIGVPGEDESVVAEVFSLNGTLQLKQKLVVPQSRLVDFNLSDLISGTYIVKVNGSTVHSSVKLLKK